MPAGLVLIGAATRYLVENDKELRFGIYLFTIFGACLFRALIAISQIGERRCGIALKAFQFVALIVASVPLLIFDVGLVTMLEQNPPGQPWDSSELRFYLAMYATYFVAIGFALFPFGHRTEESDASLASIGQK